MPGSAEGRTGVIYVAGDSERSWGLRRPPYNTEIYFDVAKTARKMGEHRSRPYDAEVYFYVLQTEKFTLTRTKLQNLSIFCRKSLPLAKNEEAKRY